MATITRNQVLAIIDTYEGMLRLQWSAELLAHRTKWCAVLAGMSACQGAGVECPCGRDHGDGFDRGESGFFAD